MRQMAEITAEIANRILDGSDPREIPRYSEIMSAVPPVVEVVQGTEEHERRIERQQREWLEERDLDR